MTSAGVDVQQRLRDEMKLLPERCRPEGNPMQVALARKLLPQFGKSIDAHGEPVRLMSMEAYCAAFLAAFLEDTPPPHGHFLFSTIPEEELVKLAQSHGIPLAREAHDDVRKMLDAIAASQPQTYLSLRRSSERLRAAAEMLRQREQK